MKNKMMQMFSAILAALMLFASLLSGCQTKEPTKQQEKGEFLQLLSFDTYEEITGTARAVRDLIFSWLYKNYERR